MGYDLFWDTDFAGKVYLLDDPARPSACRCSATTSPGTSIPATRDLVKQATDKLIELIDLVNIKTDVNAYSQVPEGTATIHQAGPAT